MSYTCEEKSFRCHTCGKRTVIPFECIEWGWKHGKYKFCTYTCMRAYTNRHGIQLRCVE